MKNNPNSIASIVRPWFFILCILLGAQVSARAAKIFFITEGSQRDTVKLLRILQAQGHDVTVWDTGIDGGAPEFPFYQEEGFELLMLDEVIGSGNVDDKWRNSPIPVVNWEGFLYSGTRSSFVTDDGVMGGTDPEGDAGYGQQTGSSINIINSDHPLAAGLPAGEVNVWDPNAESGDPGLITFAGGSTFIEGAIRVATVPGFDDRFAVFGVEEGTPDINGDPVPARWVHLPWNDSEETRVMIEPSFFLFEAGVAWALELPEPTKIHNLLPEDGGFLPADTTEITFSVDKVSNSGSAVDMSDIGLTLNGEDVSGDLSIADGGDQWDVTFDQLESNQVYTIIASATAADGGFSARMRQIDTFDVNNFTAEAEDFNFDGGMFFDEIVLCKEFGGGVDNCYFDRVGTQDIDKNEIDNVITAGDADDVYRFGPDLDRVEFMDTKITSDSLVRQQYEDADIPEYELILGENEWVNYTRTIPPIPMGASGYHVYARVSSSGPLRIQMDQVTGADQPSDQQTLEKLGQFVSDGTGGVFTLVPLTDDSGSSKVVVQMEGETSFRMTSLSGGNPVNFYMFVPTSEEQNTPPTLEITSPAEGAEFLEGDEITINADASDADGTVTVVQFFAGTEEPLELVGEDTEAPYSASFTTPLLAALSTYTLRAVATDDGGLTGADSIKVEVNDPATVVVTTADGNGADAKLNENMEGDDGDGTDDTIDVRTDDATGADARNEVGAVRFDLSGFDLSNVTDVSLNLIDQRGNEQQTLRVFGVIDGSTGLDNNGVTPGFTDNTWDETSPDLLYSTMPGLFWDGNAAGTPRLDGDRVVDLGTFDLKGIKAGADTFSTPELTSFVQENPDSLITFLIVAEEVTSSGQKRFASKDATELDGGSPTGEAGDFAPFLTFRVGAPLVTITTPADGASFNAGESITITADATDEGGSVASVEFFAGLSSEPLQSIGVDTEAPFEASFTPGSAGAHTIKAVATDNDGLSGEGSIGITVTRPPKGDPSYALPAGSNWAYELDLSGGIATADAAALDGAWNHDNGSDEWDGSAIGDNAPGGAMVVDDALRIQETGNPTDHGMPDPSNRKVTFFNSLDDDGGSATQMDDGITLYFFARVPTDGPLDDLHPDGGGTVTPYPAEGDGYINHNDGKGMIGVTQLTFPDGSRTGNGTISFSLAIAEDDAEESGLVFNSLNGTEISSAIDPGDGMDRFIPMETANWHEFWINIQADTTGVGTHRVDLWIDGELESKAFIVTAGEGNDAVGVTTDTTAVRIGLGSTGISGALDVNNYKVGLGAIVPEGGTLGPIGPGLPPMEAHWPLDDGSGTVVTDAVGDNDGTLTAIDPAAAWIDGLLDGAIRFDPDNDPGTFDNEGFIEVPHSAAIDFADEDFSISLLVRQFASHPDSDPFGNNENRYFSKGTFSGETGIRYEMFNKGGGIRFGLDDGTTKTEVTVDPDTPIVNGNWVHVVCVRDTGADELRIYANGVLLNSTADNTGSVSNDQPLWIGTNQAADQPDGLGFYNGDIDDIRVFRHALTGEEIADLTSVYGLAGPGPQISISFDAEGNIVLSWDGVLLEADNVEGPYTEVVGAESPMQVTPDQAQRFFQSQNSN